MVKRVGAWLEYYRRQRETARKKPIPHKAMAAAAGVSPQAYSNVAKGGTVSFQSLFAYLEFLGVAKQEAMAIRRLLASSQIDDEDIRQELAQAASRVLGNLDAPGIDLTEDRRLARPRSRGRTALG